MNGIKNSLSCLAVHAKSLDSTVQMLKRAHLIQNEMLAELKNDMNRVIGFTSSRERKIAVRPFPDHSVVLLLIGFLFLRKSLMSTATLNPWLKKCRDLWLFKDSKMMNRHPSEFRPWRNWRGFCLWTNWQSQSCTCLVHAVTAKQLAPWWHQSSLLLETALSPQVSTGSFSWSNCRRASALTRTGVEASKFLEQNLI